LSQTPKSHTHHNPILNPILAHIAARPVMRRRLMFVVLLYRSRDGGYPMTLDPTSNFILFLLLGVCILLLGLNVWLAIRTFSRSLDAETDTRAANNRAKELLCELLDENELRQLKESRYLDIASPSYAQRIYRIPLEEGMVSVYEGGAPVLRLCVQPISALPRHDVIAMHKLMIEGNEREYLALANAFPPAASGPGPLTAPRATHD
jgi:hypothetical protein